MGEMKTPEQMAEEWAKAWRYEEVCHFAFGNLRLCEYAQNEVQRRLNCGFLAGYQAAKDTYKEAISTYEEVAKQMLEEAVRIMSPKDQLADTGKVMNSPKKLDSWISVHKRLPEEDTDVLAFINYTVKNEPVRRVTSGAFRGGLWLTDNEIFAHPLVSHWMPLPDAPKEEK